jgi:hypothetical protein
MGHPFEEHKPHCGRTNAVVRQCQKTKEYCTATNPRGGQCDCEFVQLNGAKSWSCVAKWGLLMNVLYALTGKRSTELMQ